MSHLDITPTSTTSEPTPLQPVEYVPLPPSHAQTQDDALDTIDWPTFDSCSTWGDWMEASEPLPVQAVSTNVAEQLEDFFANWSSDPSPDTTQVQDGFTFDVDNPLSGLHRPVILVPHSLHMISRYYRTLIYHRQLLQQHLFFHHHQKKMLTRPLRNLYSLPGM